MPALPCSLSLAKHRASALCDTAAKTMFSSSCKSALAMRRAVPHEETAEERSRDPSEDQGAPTAGPNLTFQRPLARRSGLPEGQEPRIGKRQTSCTQQPERPPYPIEGWHSRILG
eukprot:CAMPEP_0206544666 /NCGR_PEP_ID=MMETSP0325_2-20121206/11675_1 /ASSEMBLY_ACC=CAM_ASM_000347 /TAXON_ID=2866 /ORGANISM="Crypthecodinium cohnii, Strain Seligo" /LENGTH=114 /DNA_ID=CAMNT_0054043501 /DNA_START=944 /DNA_END=1289 /DNA_ORIENTATION=+